MKNILKKIHISRNKYINEAVDYYNKINEKKLLEKEFKKASLICREESMKILHEFEDFEKED